MISLFLSLPCSDITRGISYAELLSYNIEVFYLGDFHANSILNLIFVLG